MQSKCAYYWLPSCLLSRNYSSALGLSGAIGVERVNMRLYFSNANKKSSQPPSAVVVSERFCEMTWIGLEMIGNYTAGSI
jgi:hypothetical protein